MHILVVEDDQPVADYIVKGLREAGHAVDHAGDGKDGLFLAAGKNYDAMVIDRMLPNVDGLTIIQTLRATENKTPIVILSALADVEERVKGLRAGGDDYLVKPFAFSELLARLEAQVRRASAQSEQTTIRVGDLVIDLLSRECHRGDQRIDLKQREFQLLEFIMRHAGHVVTRTMILENVWDYNFNPQTNVIDVHISRLRQKIDKTFDRPLLHTVRGAGYVIREPE